MTSARELAAGILSSPPFEKALAGIPDDTMASLVRHTIDIIEVCEESLAFLPDILATSNMAKMPLRRTLVREALWAGFALALEKAEVLSAVEEVVH